MSRRHRKQHQAVRPAIPTVAAAPLSARIARVSTFLLGGYALLYALTGLDLERRIALIFLGGGALPSWSLIGVMIGLGMTIGGVIVGHRLLRDARAIADQDPRGSGRLALPLVLVAGIHALLVSGPLAPWAPAAPLPGGSLLGIDLFGPLSFLLVPCAALAAVGGVFARGRAESWLRQLPD
jgi:hypothetical protein